MKYGHEIKTKVYAVVGYESNKLKYIHIDPQGPYGGDSIHYTKDKAEALSWLDKTERFCNEIKEPRIYELILKEAELTSLG